MVAEDVVGLESATALLTLVLVAVAVAVGAAVALLDDDVAVASGAVKEEVLLKREPVVLLLLLAVAELCGPIKMSDKLLCSNGAGQTRTRVTNINATPSMSRLTIDSHGN